MTVASVSGKVGAFCNL